jgi:heme/copper-type cytochrome/quinol oxidase subunit 1
MAALYYWFPKMSGRMLDKRLGIWSFWLAFIRFNATFFPMHYLGLIGMPRRIYTYQAGRGWENLDLRCRIKSDPVPDRRRSSPTPSRHRFSKDSTAT